MPLGHGGHVHTYSITLHALAVIWDAIVLWQVADAIVLWQVHADMLGTWIQAGDGLILT